MKNAMYILAVILVISWIIGFFGTSTGDVIHILLLMAIIVVILSDSQAQKSLRKLISKLK
jgi:c-di-AMP phosphodiesterase-like protein